MDVSRLSRDFEKEPLLKGEKPLESDLRYLYLECNMQREALAQYFQRSESQLKRQLMFYGIAKTKDLKQSTREQACQNKYGVNNISQLDSVKQKKKDSAQEKFGADNVFANEEIKAKIKQTNLNRYGTENVARNKNIQKKWKQTNLKRYGAENAAQSKEVKAKIINTLQDRYGVDNINKRHIDPEILSLLENTEKLQAYINSHDIKTIPYLAKQLGISTSGLGKRLHQHNLFHLIDLYTSSYELAINEVFGNIFTKTRKAIAPYEIDLYLEELNFGIEFNGNYWHSNAHLDDDYHQKKSLYAESKGTFIYHLFEYEWEDPILRPKIEDQIRNLLGQNRHKVFARKCILNEVSYKEASKFLDENHLQNKDASSIRYGLFCNDELVSLMTFCKPRYDRNHEWELSRYCTKRGTTVVGGASKLFKHFRKTNSGSIMSYSNISKTRGSLYETLGFTQIGITVPGYVWWKDDSWLTRYQCSKKKLLSLGYTGDTEKDIMESRGYIRISTCGNKVWSIKG